MVHHGEVQLNLDSNEVAQFSFDILSEPPANGLYKFGSFDDIEDREEYRAGGFHPILLGDSLPDSGQYVVIHKLGNGGFATVWLCRDLQSKTLVALKILMADKSRDDCAELKFLEWLKIREPKSSTHAGLATTIDHFWIEGPNGRHLCLVLPFLGPRVDRIWTKVAEPGKLLPKLAYQATQSLLSLHDRDICHGDFRPANLLLRVSGLDHLDDDALKGLLGVPAKDRILLADGGRPGPEAPEYVVRPVDLESLLPEFLMDDICLIDFGEVFKVSEPPEDLGIPTAYCSPELLLDKKAGVPSDIWALACTIFEIISGEPLFPDQFGDGQDVIIQWVQLLGRMPDEWWETWEARATFFDEEGSPLDEKAMKTSFEGIFEEGLTVMEGINRVKKTLKVPQSERGQLADLLSKILRYDPKERPTVEEILKHDYWKSKIGQV